MEDLRRGASTGHRERCAGAASGALNRTTRKPGKSPAAPTGGWEGLGVKSQGAGPAGDSSWPLKLLLKQVMTVEILVL